MKGQLFVDRIEIRVQNLVFTHTGPGPSSSLLPDLRERETPETESRPFVWCYPPANGLEARLEVPRSINLEELRALEIQLDSGRNDISKGLLRIRPATAGLRLRTSEIAVVAGGEDLELKPSTDSGNIDFFNLAHGNSVRLSVPYTVDENHNVLAAKVEVNYETEAGRFTFISNDSIVSTLPISVNVQDVFQLDSLLSRFTVSPATLVPLRLLDCDLPASDEYNVESGIKGGLALDVFPKQPASVIYRIKPKPGRPTTTTTTTTTITGNNSSAVKRRSLRLTVKYTRIDEECLLLIKRQFNVALAQSPHKSLQRLLTPHIVNAFREQISSSDMERIGLLRELNVLSYRDVGWNTVLSGLGQSLREKVRKWLIQWHQVGLPFFGY